MEKGIKYLDFEGLQTYDELIKDHINSEINGVDERTTQLLTDYVPTARTINGKSLSTNISLSASDVGLSNVDNTSDMNKPVSTAAQELFNTKENNIPSFKTWEDYEKAKGTVAAGTYFVVEEDQENPIPSHNSLRNLDADECHPIRSITGLQSALDGKTDVLSTAVIEERLNQIVGSVPEGSADEVADARVMVDGVTASNLGTAIRTQVSTLKETIAEIGTLSDNLYNKSASVDGYAIQSGRPYPADYYCYAIIAVEPNQTYCISHRLYYDNNMFTVQWDENENTIDGTLVTGGGAYRKVTTVSTAKYICLTIPTIAKEYCKVEKSDVPTAYTPYGYIKSVYEPISKNMYNKNNRTDGRRCMNGTSWTASEAYGYSIIPVEANAYYTINHVGFTANKWFHYRNNEMAYIADSNVDASGNGNVTITTKSPSDAAYLVISYDLKLIDLLQIEKGKIRTDYVPYADNKTYLNIKTGTEGYFVTRQPEKIEGITRHIKSKNLYNKADVVKGYKNAFGTPDANAGYCYIIFPCKPNTTYTLSQDVDLKNNVWIWQGDNSRRPITGTGGQSVTTANAVYTFTTVSNAEFICVTVATTAYENIQIEEGNTATEYEEYYDFWSFNDSVSDATAKLNAIITEQHEKEISNITSIVDAECVTKYKDEETALYSKVLQTLDRDKLTFLLFTDMHASDIANDYIHGGTQQGGTVPGYKNYRQFGLMAKRIAENLGLDFIVNLGDTINSTTDEWIDDINVAENKKRLTEFTRRISSTFIPYIYATAHHEMHPVGNKGLDFGEVSTDALTRSELYGICNRFARNYDIITNSNDVNKNYFYFDIDVPNVRIIVLDSCSKTNYGYSDAQVTWLQSVTNTNKKIIVFSHMGTNVNQMGSSVENGAEIEAVLNNSGNVIAYFHGHTHFDNIIRPDQSGLSYPVISTDKMWTFNYAQYPSEVIGNPFSAIGRKYKTYTEYLFDIVSIDCNTGNIKMFRFGAGSDRTYTR